MTAIGRALMSRPKMILLDEPSMGLAPQLVEEIFEIVKKLNEEQGVSFLLAEQNTNTALRFAKYGYILESGRVVLDGEASALRENEDVKGLGQAEQDAGDHPAHGAAEVDLLRHHHDADATLAPVGQQADPLVLAPRDPVELPDHDRVDLAVEDRPLHPVEGGSHERRAALAVLVPADRSRS